MIEFIDPEILVSTRLRAAYMPEGVFVGREVPDPVRNEMITVKRFGGIRISRFVESVRLGVNVYAETDLRANALASEVRSVMETMTGAPVKRVSTEGISEVPNTTRLSQRYFIVYFDIRGTAKADGEETQ